jgi:hypothetical protein
MSQPFLYAEFWRGHSAKGASARLVKSESMLLQAFDCAVNIAGRAKEDGPWLTTSGRDP